MSNDTNTSGCGCVLGPGSVGAVLLSIALNHSIGWAVLHFFLGWLYVGYVLLFRAKEVLPALARWFG